MREFEELIKEIEYDGKKIIPAQKIAAICFGVDEYAVKVKHKMWINNGYDYMLWYSFSRGNITYSIGMSRNFDVSKYIKIGSENTSSNAGFPPCNQVEIVKSLIEWGFVSI